MNISTPTSELPSIAMLSQNENCVSNLKMETIEWKEMTYRLIKCQWFAKSMFAMTISEMPAERKQSEGEKQNYIIIYVLERYLIWWIRYGSIIDHVSCSSNLMNFSFSFVLFFPFYFSFDFVFMLKGGGVCLNIDITKTFR